MSDRPHKKLNVWIKSIELCKKIYRLTRKFPTEEKFGLIQNMRRAVISIPTNIAEGAARHTSKEKVQFFFISRGSISELDTQIEISYQLSFISEKEKNEIIYDIDEVSRLLNGLIVTQRKKI